jgi:hypothetical protein
LKIPRLASVIKYVRLLDIMRDVLDELEIRIGRWNEKIKMESVDCASATRDLFHLEAEYADFQACDILIGSY